MCGLGLRCEGIAGSGNHRSRVRAIPRLDQGQVRFRASRDSFMGCAVFVVFRRFFLLEMVIAVMSKEKDAEKSEKVQEPR